MRLVSQVNRFQRIQNEFGKVALLRTSVLLVGVVGMALLDFFAFSNIRAAVIVAVGLVLGFLFRRKIADGVEYYPRALTVGLFVYSIVLLLGDLMGLERGVKLAIITTVTVVLFDLNFWSLSDPSVVNAERHNRR